MEHSGYLHLEGNSSASSLFISHPHHMCVMLSACSSTVLGNRHAKFSRVSKSDQEPFTLESGDVPWTRKLGAAVQNRLFSNIEQDGCFRANGFLL